MNLLLIREHFEHRGNISQGLGIIGTIAKEVATVKIIDNNSLYKTHTIANILDKIRSCAPDVIGFHVNIHNIYVTSLLIAAVRKTFPHICLIGGGLHAYQRPLEILEIGVHICAAEEADLTIIPLLQALSVPNQPTAAFSVTTELAEKLEQIPGLIFNMSTTGEQINTGRPKFIQNLDELPFVDHDLFNLEDYIFKPYDAKYVTDTLLTQRGCPFKCSFCQGPVDGVFRMTREASPEYKFRYVKYLFEKHGHNTVLFFDANFTLNRKNVLAFCDLMIESGLNKKVKFMCDTNVSAKMDEHIAAKLQEAGCSDIALGVERLDKESLQQIGKNKNFQMIMDNIRLLDKTDIRICTNALMGFPFDTVDTVKREEKLFTDLEDLVDSINVGEPFTLSATY